MMCDKANNRITEQFLELTRLDAVSFQEQSVAAVIKRELEKLGFEVFEDKAGEPFASPTGNLYGILHGTAPKEPVLFSAHMDTVEPGIGKKPILKDGKITSDGTTVLGADDVCGIVEILEGIRLVSESGDAHGDVEVLFTVAEELYGKGAKAFDYSKIRSREAYVLDMSGEPGRAAHKAPSIVSFEITVTGKAAHAGFAPAAGVNALAAAAKAIARIPQGKVSEQTTLNIGTIRAGTADNIVPEACRCTGEVRSFDHKEALEQMEIVRETFEQEAGSVGAQTDWTQQVHLTAYETLEEAPVCKDFQRACEETGLPGVLTVTHGGSDNNVFALHNIEGIVLSCGMQRTHSTDEYVLAEDLVKGAQLVAAIVKGRHRVA